MGFFALLLVLAADGPADTLGRKMLPVYLKEVEAYSLAVESAPKKPLELNKEPVFEWSNPIRNGGQQGVVFVWLHDGRPAALSCIFSAPAPQFPDGRRITHESHALDPEKLVVTRDAWNQWKPEAGLDRAEIADAGTPADAPGARLVQMRKIAQEFTGHATDRDRKQWSLRLLPAPLYRYPAAMIGVVDGAVFALVSEAGTDPEVLLVIEARDEGGKKKWEYACGRFSDWELRVQRRDKEVFSSVPGEENPFHHDPKHLYRTYADKIVATDGRLLARIRQSDQRVYGEIVPVEEKSPPARPQEDRR
ncbi:hypothetical protein [Fimbriiglobus ruber]|uniref:Uncharacterized protein n=1 Tax=Fimbriiglobus ruber TaxID=1908690 RepID=A0A225DPM9_9BACT|nr:hypothetical protein [Fimbriiglobus ruber]OWK43043.1 hypothetical protein FRUB_02642 [Fimbriiglobus ruber]